MHTKGPTARHPYTCGGIPQHSTLQHQDSAEPMLCKMGLPSSQLVLKDRVCVCAAELMYMPTRLIAHCTPAQRGAATMPSQRSLHNAPIFRLLLKVAVNGTHQCDFLNFCGDSGPQHHNGKVSSCWKKLASLLPLEKFCYG